MPRILHVLDHSLPLQSGYSFRTRAILKAQERLGFEVRGITGLRHYAKGPPTEEAEGLTFHRTAGKADGPPLVREWREITASAGAIEALAREWRPDVLHAHSPSLCGQAALRAGRKLGIPVVYEIRAFWEDAAVGNRTGREGSARYWLTRQAENHVVSQADAVVTICHGLKNDLVARGFSPEKISIMPNGVDLALFGTAAPRDETLSDQLNLGNGPVIGFIGSFYDYEGLDDLIAAMPALLEQHGAARLLLVGGGPMETKLAEQARKSPVAHAIRFAGRVPHAEVDRYYSLCEIMAYPRKASRLTDLVTPLKPLEAMAQGKLVAASSVGGHRELMQEGVTASLFAPDDPADCAETLATLLTQRDEWPRIREKARLHVETEHDWLKNARNYQDVYHRLIGSQGELPSTAAA